MAKRFWVVAGMLLLLAIEIFSVYFIMPFPGSQHHDTIGLAYFISRNRVWLRLLGFLIVLPPIYSFLKSGGKWTKIGLFSFFILYALLFYLVNFRFLADKIFYQPKEKKFIAGNLDSSGNSKLVLGVSLGGEAKAYPIEIIGYHHQVKDSLGGKPIMVTYCTVCRTGRVFSPFANGKYELFRLVGMDHFNAMFEDEDTKSWWQQATGKAIAGPLKGSQLPEIPSAQMTLGDWLQLHPNSLVLQPDKNFLPKYDSLKGYDEGVIESSLEKRDTASWKFKSWVIGCSLQGFSKAYDWNMLVKNRIIQDKIGNINLLVTISDNNKSFFVFALAPGQLIDYDPKSHFLTDHATHVFWKTNGQPVDSLGTARPLDQIQAYQEFWHSWQQFHPNTMTYK